MIKEENARTITAVRENTSCNIVIFLKYMINLRIEILVKLWLTKRAILFVVKIKMGRSKNENISK